MSDYNYNIIKESVAEWCDKAVSGLKNKCAITLSKNSDEALIVDFDFQNCIAQLSVTNSSFVPYQFVYFEAMATNASTYAEPIYCFYDDDTMRKADVIDALNEALVFCVNYKAKK